LPQNYNEEEMASHIPDTDFIRSKIPMTKQEVRAATVAKMHLSNDDIVWDVGAGTGSVSVEMALNMSNGHVYAIERNEEALQLIKQNADKFNLENISIISSEAPVGFDTLMKPTKVFIGGSGGNLLEILEYLHQNISNFRIVANAIVLDTLNTLLDFFETRNYQNIEAVQLSVNRIEKKGNSRMILANNPVFIVSADKSNVERIN